MAEKMFQEIELESKSHIVGESWMALSFTAFVCCCGTNCHQEKREPESASKCEKEKDIIDGFNLKLSR